MYIISMIILYIDIHTVLPYKCIPIVNKNRWLHGVETTPMKTALPRCDEWCWNIYLQHWVVYGVNVGKYYIHGASGIWNITMTFHGKQLQTLGYHPTLSTNALIRVIQSIIGLQPSLSPELAGQIINLAELVR